MEYAKFISRSKILSSAMEVCDFLCNFVAVLTAAIESITVFWSSV